VHPLQTTMRPQAFDTLAFFAVTISLTLAMTSSGWVVWGLAPVFLLAVARGYQKPTKPSAVDTFKTVKIASAIGAVFVVNASQLGLSVAKETVAAMLAVNMLQAVITDLAQGAAGWPNAVAGLVLVLLLPGELHKVSGQGGVFIAPLSMPWVFVYTTWNATFCYGVGFAWSFCLILATPLAVSATLGLPNAWLGARTYSLVLNQVLRGSRALWIFVPGASYITKAENAPSTNQLVRVAAGVVNLGLCAWLVAGA
jgi:hypothetical protein